MPLKAAANAAKSPSKSLISLGGAPKEIRLEALGFKSLC
jgi:hypothetical protein